MGCTAQVLLPKCQKVVLLLLLLYTKASGSMRLCSKQLDASNVNEQQ